MGVRVLDPGVYTHFGIVIFPMNTEKDHMQRKQKKGRILQCSPKRERKKGRNTEKNDCLGISEPPIFKFQSLLSPVS